MRRFALLCLLPEAFARWVLADQPEWSPERIEAALADPHETRVAVRFCEDLYGHDAELERALARGGP